MGNCSRESRLNAGSTGGSGFVNRLSALLWSMSAEVGTDVLLDQQRCDAHPVTLEQ